MAEGQEIIKAKLLQPLSKLELGLEILRQEAEGLTLSEDNIEDIGKFLEKGSKALKAVAEKHKIEKEPYLRRCQEYDAAKKTIEGLVGDIFNPVKEEYQKLCRAAEERRKADAAQELWISNTKKGINDNIIAFSERIQAAKTIAQIVEVERLVNLEKGRKEKYGDLLPFAVEQFSALTDAIKEQKENIRALDEAAKEAGDSVDDTAVSVAVQKVNDTGYMMVQRAVEQGSAMFPWERVKEDVPEVKAKRSVWKWEVTEDFPITSEKHKVPPFAKLVVDKDAVDAYLEKLKKDGDLKGKEEEFRVYGIRFYLSKTY